ncbi:putative Ig domain-containing protein [Subtercola sp. PAMC28395]|uniref:putative Ig domain-containing protein n=1 Tax=Subtercola sp. PAMC28395 TaxID=2846775 RepID=UPI001C0BF717|nr:putative Ig domain-containing protein [Subtercola sp. PAMC28395]QWT25006.1 putative Ig domain-containing protein [Subtercola sp. PAMC28395]
MSRTVPRPRSVATVVTGRWRTRSQTGLPLRRPGQRPGRSSVNSAVAAAVASLAAVGVIVGSVLVGEATAAQATPVVTGTFASLAPGSRPSAIALGDDGSVFTADSGRDAVSKVSPAGITDPAFHGWLPLGALPSTLVYSKGALLVTSPLLDKLWMIDASSGEINTSFDAALGLSFDGRHPSAVAADATGTIYVLAADDQRVVAVSRAGAVLAEYSLDPAAGTQALVFGDDGSLFTANPGDGTISRIVFDHAGHGVVEPAWATAGPGVRPQALAFDHHGYLYSVSSAHETVSKFDTRLPPGLNLAAEYDLSGSYPLGIASDALGNVYTSNVGDDTISLFAADGSPAATVATLPGTPDAESVVADTRGSLFTANFSANSISRVELAPKLTSSPPPGTGQVGAPYASAAPTTSGLDPTGFTVSGTLPFGLRLDPVTGVISGTPTTAATFDFDLIATNSVGRSGPQHVSLTIAPVTGSTGCWYSPLPCGL